jgi:hypothetical protein
MSELTKIVTALSMALLAGVLPQTNSTTAAEQNSATAIDMLLEPDATMLEKAQVNNAQLLKVFPKGFTLDEAHRPHITLLQRFVRTEDLDQVYVAVGRVFSAADVKSLKLEAFKYYYTPGGEIGVANILVHTTPELLKLQQELMAAVAPFALETAPIGAFTAPQDTPAEDALLIDYVSSFVPKQIGEHFDPHVSTGVAPKDYLDKMVTEPFDAFTFSPAGAAVYHIGPYGTAARKLKEWD